MFTKTAHAEVDSLWNIWPRTSITVSILLPDTPWTAIIMARATLNALKSLLLQFLDSFFAEQRGLIAGRYETNMRWNTGRWPRSIATIVPTLRDLANMPNALELDAVCDCTIVRLLTVPRPYATMC
jgi:hypothetical protein